MKFKKIITMMLTGVMLVGATSLMGCSSEKKKDLDKITMVWYPNESGGDLEEARQEVGKIIEDATGLEVEHKLTTDYSVAIESISNGTAQIAFMGPQGYVEAHNKNEKILPLVVSSGESGTLDDAVYYSWLSVLEENAKNYIDGDEYSIDNIVGKKMSFVSNSSTSGFKVPTSGIVKYFSDKGEYKDLTAEDLMEGGSDKFFSEVLYGGSHQGSMVNLISGNADVAAFCDTVAINYVEAIDGEFNKLGTTYAIKDNAEDPFTEYSGKKFTAISVTPVLNSPFAANTEVLDKDIIDKIIEAFEDDKVTNNEKIFVPEDSEESGFFKKKGEERFLRVKDEWFNPVRELS